ncbi:MAG: 2-C-methyl-D-erythritol 4-phosphate cytidylyltransferase [Desulfotomaculales bacterium]
MARAVVLAAGRSRRMGEGVNKQLVLLAGRPVLAHSLAVLEECTAVEEYVVVVAPGEEEKIGRLAREEWGCRKLAAAVAGGETRQESVRRGLAALPPDTRIVVVHDGARPFITVELVNRVISAAALWGAAIPAVPVKETVKKAAGSFVAATVDREGLWLAQTPQAFFYSLLREAHLRAGKNGAAATDDAALLEVLGTRVRIVEGSVFNIKITTPEDLDLARAIAAAPGGGAAGDPPQ